MALATGEVLRNLKLLPVGVSEPQGQLWQTPLQQHCPARQGGSHKPEEVPLPIVSLIKLATKETMAKAAIMIIKPIIAAIKVFLAFCTRISSPALVIHSQPPYKIIIVATTPKNPKMKRTTLMTNNLGSVAPADGRPKPAASFKPRSCA
ncbi:MAG: hypothetical protein BWY51_00622 [Parcubacteria group bacterium ADurb.Bin316]|nr:MAG: hypothetical protein BWY51_00622 [Parcubacteria group bacterium ADurb.Bin316]